ncbi:MAG: hypothetical protein P4M00_18650 [Azospirillaceae bacterium]|nr:hypothetical protein [Azospirillaceae bacterium]
MVNVSTVRPGHDPACRLFVGDHAFIRRESFVEYAMARVELAQKISDSVANRVLVPCADLDSAIFARVCHGLTISQFIKPRFLTYYHDHTGL